MEFIAVFLFIALPVVPNGNFALCRHELCVAMFICCFVLEFCQLSEDIFKFMESLLRTVILVVSLDAFL